MPTALPTRSSSSLLSLILAPFLVAIACANSVCKRSMLRAQVWPSQRGERGDDSATATARCLAAMRMHMPTRWCRWATTAIAPCCGLRLVQRCGDCLGLVARSHATRGPMPRRRQQNSPVAPTSSSLLAHLTCTTSQPRRMATRRTPSCDEAAHSLLGRSEGGELAPRDGSSHDASKAEYDHGSGYSAYGA